MGWWCFAFGAEVGSCWCVVCMLRGERGLGVLLFSVAELACNASYCLEES